MSLLENCFAYWDGKSLSAVIGNGLFATSGSPTYTTVDRLNVAGTYRFPNATSDYLTSSTITSSTAKTAIVWIYIDTIVSTKSILMHYIDCLNTTSTSTIGSEWNTPTLYVNGIATTTISSGVWMMIAATSAGGSTSTQPRINNGTNTGLVCTVGECFLYSTVLSAGEIAALYAITKNKYIYPFQRGERGCY
jgi:hypothetical protein